MDWLSIWGVWLIFGFVLLILEVFVPGVFVMWWGLAALCVAGISALCADLEFGWQAILFACLAGVFSLLWWKYQHDKDRKDDRHTELNARDHHLIGKIGVVEEIVESHIIRAKFGDTTWKVQGERLSVGDKVEVLGVEGIILQVRKMEKGE